MYTCFRALAFSSTPPTHLALRYRTLDFRILVFTVILSILGGSCYFGFSVFLVLGLLLKLLLVCFVMGSLRVNVYITSLESVGVARGML